MALAWFPILALVLSVANAWPSQRVIHLKGGDIHTHKQPRRRMATQSAGAQDPKHFLLHFDPEKDPKTWSIRDELVSFFGNYGQHIPMNTFMIYTTDQAIYTFAKNASRLAWHDVLPSKNKLCPDLAKQVGGSPPNNTTRPFDFLVRVADGSDIDIDLWKGRMGGARAHEVAIKWMKKNELDVRVPWDLHEHAIGYATRQGPTWYVHQLPRLRTFVTPVQSIQGTPQGSDYLAIWENGILGDTQLIGIGDTGVDHDHCMFYDEDNELVFHPDRSTTHRKIFSYVKFDPQEFCGVDNTAPINPNIPIDSTDVPGGHGTHVAGCAVGVQKCVEPPADPKLWWRHCQSQLSHPGMAPKARLFVNDMAPEAGNPYLPCDVAAFFRKSYDMSTRIHANAWGVAPTDDEGMDYTWLSHEVDDFAWNHRRALLIFSAGNIAQQGLHGVSSPGNSKNILTVGATEASSGKVALFSSYGPTKDGRIKPDILAPGLQIPSASSEGSTPIIDRGDCQYMAKSGTSQSAGLVAGAAALLREYLAKGYWFAGQQDFSKAITLPEAALMKALLIISGDLLQMTAEEDISGEAQTRLPTNRQGFGQLNLLNIMPFFNASDKGHRIFFNSHKGDYLGQQQTRNIFDQERTHVFCITVTKSSRPLKIVLAWIEPATSLLASKILLNDLDLVVANSYRTWKGNANSSLPGNEQTFDKANTVELVDIDVPPPGQYKVYVHLNQPSVSPEVDTATLPYTLVISGAFEGPADGFCPTSPAWCPSNGAVSCSGGGTCNSGECTCWDPNSHIDCSELKFEAPVEDPICAACTTDPTCTHQCDGMGCTSDVGVGCRCFSDAFRGYYDEEGNCAECGSIPGSLAVVSRDSEGRCTVPSGCNGHGIFSSGGCQCSQFGDGSGDGSWAGEACEKCADGWFGPACKCQSADCDGHGICIGDAGCVCHESFEDGFWGSYKSNSQDNCRQCKAGYGTEAMGCRCKLEAGKLCSGHGDCTPNGCVCHAQNHTGWWVSSQPDMPSTCDLCDASHDGASCRADKLLCTFSRNGRVTEHGCECYSGPDNGYWMSDNIQQWDVLIDSVVVSYGTNCLKCAQGYYGPDSVIDSGCLCKKSTGADSILCSGNGVCDGENGCQCFGEDQLGSYGYWTSSGEEGANCDICAPGYVGAPTEQYPNGNPSSGCKCAYDNVNGFCNGHGTCHNVLGCICDQEPSKGFFASSTPGKCDVCMPGAGLYPQCKCKFSDCNGHGTCDILEGCQCSQSPQQGYWGSTADALTWQNVAEGETPAEADLTNSDCAVCMHGFTSPSTGCQCDVDRCSLWTPDSTSSCIDTFNDPKCTANLLDGNPDGTNIRFEYEAGGLPSTHTLQFSYINTTFAHHPSKAVPTGYLYVPKTAFEITPRPLGWTLSSKFQRQVVEVGNVQFPTYLQVEIEVPSPIGFVDNDGNPVQVNLDSNPPELFVKPPLGNWTKASTFCDPVYATVSDAADLLQASRTSGRICMLQGTGASLFAMYVVNETPSNAWVIILIAALTITACIVVFAIILRIVLAKARTAKRQAAIKESLLHQITKMKQKPLRARLGLKMNEDFTAELAIERVLKYSVKARARLKRYAAKSGGPLGSVDGIPSRPGEGAMAISTLLNEGDIPKVWTFADHELGLLDACRKVRGMFVLDPYTKEFNLRSNAMPQLQQALSQLEIDNAKLKRLLYSLQSKTEKPKSALLPANKGPHPRILASGQI